MATSLRHPQYNSRSANIVCPSSFPGSFNDFFTTLQEDDDSVDFITSVLEDKLIPRSSNMENSKLSNMDMYRKSKRSANASIQRRSSEIQCNTRPQYLNTTKSVPGEASPAVSPAVARRRSSSIAVTRAAPDLHRFLQAEQQNPWGHLGVPSCSPSRSHLNPNQPIPSPTSPSFASRAHLSPGTTPREPPSPRSRYPPLLTCENNRASSRSRTGSMPVVPNKHRPRLAETRRSAIHCGDEDIEYYRLRSFSITANGVFNLGDSLRSRRSRSINSVTSTGTSCSGNSGNRDRFNSTGSGTTENDISSTAGVSEKKVQSYKVAMLGAAGVGKTALTYQFTTSEYICAYDASLDEEYGQKTVSVMVDGQETELEIVDHPACEMSVEAFCATYNADVFVVVYSVVDRKSMKAAEEILLYLWKGDYMATRGVILVANKADLERKREVPMVVGRRLAHSCGCKFIETSSGLDHNVDELLVGILAQVKLNPKRDRDKLSRKRSHKVRMGSGRRILKHLLGMKRKTKSCENLFVI